MGCRRNAQAASSLVCLAAGGVAGGFAVGKPRRLSGAESFCQRKRTGARLVLEQFKKYCSLSGTVLFVSGFVSAQSQAAVGMLIRQSLARTKKSSFRTA